MRILFIGDSITKGTSGVNFIKLIKQELPSCQVINCGVNGDTLNNMSLRLLNHLKWDNRFDYIVLQGGYNDIFLPYLSKKGNLFRFALNQQLKKGLVPLNTAGFEDKLRRTIKEMKQVYKGKIILTTLGCINEYLQFELNQKRAAYNTAIRQIAGEEGVCVADCALQFDNLLSKEKQVDYFLENFWAVTITNPLICSFSNGAELLSRKRGLHLTIDGVHLNHRGAQIFKDCIIQVIKNEESKAGAVGTRVK